MTVQEWIGLGAFLAAVVALLVSFAAFVRSS